MKGRKGRADEEKKKEGEDEWKQREEETTKPEMKR